MEKQIKNFIVTDKIGLHARPATLLVNEASKFSSNARIKCKGGNADLKSIMGVMTLGLSNGNEFEIELDGTDSKEAMTAILNVLKSVEIAKEVK